MAVNHYINTTAERRSTMTLRTSHRHTQSLLGEISNEERNRERNLVGSLTDTYKFRKGGLIKKTISIHLNGSTQHMISYYTRSDVLEGKLATPSSVSDLSNLQISPDLLLKQSFRVPPSVEFAESLLKKPSLSPTSTNSTTSTTATTTAGIRRKLSHVTIGIHSMYEIQPARVSHEEYPPLCKLSLHFKVTLHLNKKERALIFISFFNTTSLGSFSKIKF